LEITNNTLAVPHKIATWNVNSIAARLPLVLRWLESQQPDVLCLQELKCLEAKFPFTALSEAGYHSLVFGQPTYNGVAILVRQPLAEQISQMQKGFGELDAINNSLDTQSRLISATVGNIRIINVYVPNGQAVGTDKYAYKLAWFERLRTYLDTQYATNERILLCGDFNVAPEPLDVYDPAVWEGKILFSQPEKEALQRVKAWGLVDSFRQLYPDRAEAYSWWDYRQASFQRNLGLRIDHLLLSPALMTDCRDVVIDAAPRSWERPSDHVPVTAVLV
jgi:exodeoxyribonuclease-3